MMGWSSGAADPVERVGAGKKGRAFCAVTNRVQCRSIYEASGIDDPVTRRIVQPCAEAGAHARLLPQLPMKLADHTAAMRQRRDHHDACGNPPTDQ
jgi:hypothetical protein